MGSLNGGDRKWAFQFLTKLLSRPSVEQWLWSPFSPELKLFQFTYSPLSRDHLLHFGQNVGLWGKKHKTRQHFSSVQFYIWAISLNGDWRFETFSANIITMLVIKIQNTFHRWTKLWHFKNMRKRIVYFKLNDELLKTNKINLHVDFNSKCGLTCVSTVCVSCIFMWCTFQGHLW